MIYVAEFTAMLLALISPHAFVGLGVTLLVAGALHLWTVQHHEHTGSPNLTLLQLCNVLCVCFFIISCIQIFRRSSPDNRVPPGWGLVCVSCVVYFLSIFGVWFVASVIDEANLDECVSEDTPPRRRDAAAPLCDHGKVKSELLNCNESIAKASTSEEVWGEGAILWHLTRSDALSVGMLRETEIGRTVGLFCTRTCGRCLECDWCNLLNVWKEYAIFEMSSRTSSSDHFESASRSGRKRRRASPPLPSIPECSGGEETSGESDAEDPTRGQ
mmetsp:Transcript_33261/g.96370  ORF Transcript_33261/g.96370 Transcript_33261/m.96370 type:complete len:272 (-) Transcript_33261:463-1278(-)